MIRQFIFLISIFAITSETTAQVSSKFERFEFAHKCMGTLFRIICYSEDAKSAKTASMKAFARVDSLNYIMSDYLPDSELNRLCRSSGKGNYIKVSSDLFEIINHSLQWSDRTNGIFDITIGPYSQLWRRAGRKDLLPTSHQIQVASKSIGYRYIHVDSDRKRILLEKPNMQLDLGGIAKGFAVDEMYEIFIQTGIHHVLIDGGGDIRAGEAPPGKEGWKIVLENLNSEQHSLFLSNSSIATSGDLYRYIQIDSVKYSHIVDPRTGYGLTVPRTVTIQTDNCTDADALASILSILGPVEGFRFLQNVPGSKALIVQAVGSGIERFEKGKLDIIK
jgi:thiamine biosynthesis lipoprotein